MTFVKQQVAAPLAIHERENLPNVVNWEKAFDTTTEHDIRCSGSN